MFAKSVSRRPLRWVASVPVLLGGLLLAACAAPIPSSSAPLTGPADSVPSAGSTPSEGTSTGGSATGGSSTGGSSAEPTAPVQSGGSGLITVTMTGQSFEFEPVVCLITSEDLLAHGPGRDTDSGEPAYIDIDIATLDNELFGEVRITLGTDERFAGDSDDIAAFIGDGSDYGVFWVDDGFRMDTAFKNTSTLDPLGPAQVSADCS